MYNENSGSVRAAQSPHDRAKNGPALACMFDESRKWAALAHDNATRIENVVDRLVGSVPKKAPEATMTAAQSGLVGEFVSTLDAQRELASRLGYLADRLEILA